MKKHTLNMLDHQTVELCSRCRRATCEPGRHICSGCAEHLINAQFRRANEDLRRAQATFWAAVKASRKAVSI